LGLHYQVHLIDDEPILHAFAVIFSVYSNEMGDTSCSEFGGNSASFLYVFTLLCIVRYWFLDDFYVVMYCCAYGGNPEPFSLNGWQS
jgi:uncharacterized oligopeptide transporter (OPT) family protein